MTTSLMATPRRRTIPKLNENHYGRLLAKVHPVVIKTEEQNERSLLRIEALMRKVPRSPEEDALLELLMQLSEDFERGRYKRNTATPMELIRFLLEQRQQSPRDLWDVLGKSRVSEILSGTRPVTKSQAVKLGRFFGISPAPFVFPLHG
jgi:HTH-type transcriptional regulator / antitoxin HigA